MNMIPYKSLFVAVVKTTIVIIYPNRKFRIESSLINLNLTLKERKLCLAVVTVRFSSTCFEIALKFGQVYTACFRI